MKQTNISDNILIIQKPLMALCNAGEQKQGNGSTLFDAKTIAELGSLLCITQRWLTMQKPEEKILSKISEDEKF